MPESQVVETNYHYLMNGKAPKQGGWYSEYKNEDFRESHEG
jgi:hypothetical protein